MQLFEFEGKQLFKKCGINVPESQLIESRDSSPSTALRVRMTLPVILKAQVLSGKRADAGGIVKVTQGVILNAVKDLFQKTVNGEKVEKILVEEMVEIEKEYYLSFSYDTASRGPIITFTESGGTGIEERGAETHPINILEEFTKNEAKKYVPEELAEIAVKLWEVFTKYDCELAEINPLVIGVIPTPSTTLGTGSVEGSNSTESGVRDSSTPLRSARNDKIVYALDAKVILDDDADFRREEKFPERNLFGRPPTSAEIEARKIDEGDHRGTAGSVYWDLDGDIAVIAAGGGGSIVNMDALLAFGGRPANYTEHSGNPPREKLKKLTKIILSKPGLKGCWFVGGTANFTDIYETLMGFVEGLREIRPKPGYPIVIRRGGPRDKEAFEVLKEIGKKEGFDFHIFGRETPMTSTAKVMVDLAYEKK